MFCLPLTSSQEAIHGLSAAADAAALVAEAPEPRVSRVGDGAHQRLSRAGILAGGGDDGLGGNQAAGRVGSEETDFGWRPADSTAVQAEAVKAPPNWNSGLSGRGSAIAAALDSVSAAKGSVLEGTSAAKAAPVLLSPAAIKKGAQSLVNPQQSALERVRRPVPRWRFAEEPRPISPPISYTTAKSRRARVLNRLSLSLSRPHQNLTTARTNSTIEAFKKTAGAVQARRNSTQAASRFWHALHGSAPAAVRFPDGGRAAPGHRGRWCKRLPARWPAPSPRSSTPPPAPPAPPPARARCRRPSGSPARRWSTPA